MWLTRLALRNPILILMVTLMTLMLGGLCLSRLGVDLFPNIDMPQIRVATFYQGAAPEDIEKSVTRVLERAVASTPGAERVESVSKQGASIIDVVFPYGTNLDAAQFEVQQRLSQVQNQLPPGLPPSTILKFDATMLPTVALVARAEGLDDTQLYELLSDVIAPQFERLPGVAGANIGGGRQRQIDVRVDASQLRGRDLGILDVVDAVRKTHLMLPSGSVRVGDQELNVVANTQVAGPRELSEVVVATQKGVVRLGDVAQIEDGAADRQSIYRVNGDRAVVIRIYKQPGANTLATADAVRRLVGEVRGAPPNLKLQIAHDESIYITHAIRDLEHEAVQGGFLAVIVILVFLLDLRATWIVAVAIPLSIVATFVFLYFAGATINVFTLGGLSLGVGRLVDDSIVELENIHRHLSENTDRRAAVLGAAEEVATPILVSTLTTIIVFFPVLFLKGIARNLFVPFAATIAFALIASLFVSRTVTPLLCLYGLRAGHAAKKAPGRIARSILGALERIDRAYERALRWTLERKAPVILGILAVFVLSLGLTKLVGTELFPSADERVVWVSMKAPIGTRIERSEEVGVRVERAIRAELRPTSVLEGADGLLTQLDCGLPGGRAALFSQASGGHACNLRVYLADGARRAYSDKTAAAHLRRVLGPSVSGTTMTYNSGGTVQSVLNFGAGAPIDVEVLGQDLNQSQAYAERVAARLRSLVDEHGRPLVTDVQLSREERAPGLDIVVDRLKAGLTGVTQKQVAETVLASINGNTPFAPIMFSSPASGQQYFINVRLDDRFRTHLTDLRDLTLRTPSGATLPLESVGRIERSSAPVQIKHKYLQRVIDVTANVGPDVDLGRASAGVERSLQELPAPDGVTAQLGGVSKMQKDAFGGMALAALMALLLVYMVLASQFKSLLDPLVIMFSVPLGITGVLVALVLTKTTISINSGMGVIMMVGIVVSNGVLLVDFANVLAFRGEPILEATVIAARTRLRPILMTSIATVAGLVPMAIGIGGSANTPLARAVIGGLTVSTVFTLFLIPCLYIALRAVKAHVSARWGRRVSDHSKEQLADGEAATACSSALSRERADGFVPCSESLHGDA